MTNRLQDETARVDDVLCEETSLDAMVKCFVAAKANSFENLLEPFLKICRLSKGVTIGISKSQFFQRLIDRLGHSKPVVRLTLLRLLKAILDVHPNRSSLVEKFGIYDIVEKFSNQDGALLVREIAREIMPTLSPALKPAASRLPKNGEGTTPKLSLAVKRRPRRTASELGVSTSEIQPRLQTASTSRLQPSGSKGVSRGSRQKLGDITWNGNPR